MHGDAFTAFCGWSGEAIEARRREFFILHFPHWSNYIARRFWDFSFLLKELLYTRAKGEQKKLFCSNVLNH